MSLNLSLITPRFVCQVSDRRLRRVTRDGTNELYTDQANKATIFECKDAICAITFHGIGASLDGTSTDRWLMDRLEEIYPTQHSIVEILEELRKKSSSWMMMMEQGAIGAKPALCHTFVIVGWVKARLPFIAFVANYELLLKHNKVGKPWPEFVISARNLAPLLPPFMQASMAEVVSMMF